MRELDVGESLEKLIFHALLVECMSGPARIEKSMAVPKKIKQFPYDPIILLKSIYPEELKIWI